MKEVAVSLVLLAAVVMQVKSSHCTTSDHIQTYDNFLSLSGLQCSSEEPPICAFPCSSSGISSNYGCRCNSYPGKCGNSGTCGNCGRKVTSKCRKVRPRVRSIDSYPLHERFVYCSHYIIYSTNT